ncbi:MAG: hypothetical protein GX578_04280 [Clostridiales bacterium]|nr:hypothetical protein [Clostridiales bacterium]
MAKEGEYMDLQELLSFLEIDTPMEFEYFENFADLVECEEIIPESTLFLLFSETDKRIVGEIIINYFDDMLESLPDDSNDIYTLLEKIKLSMAGLIKASDDQDILSRFPEQLNAFKNWYCFESAVACKDPDTGEEKLLTLRDALTLARLQKLEGEEYIYDFSECMNYEVDDYMVNISELAEPGR